MKRKIMSMSCALVLTLGLAFSSMQSVKAASTDPILDGSYLTHDEESIGYDTKITRGVDLMAGYSKCTKLGEGKIYAGGTTIAAHEIGRASCRERV